MISVRCFFFFLSVCLLPALPAKAAEKIDIPFKPFYVYKDAGAKENHFTPTGWMGQIECLDLKDDFIRNAKSMDTCIRIIYTPVKKSAVSGWSGVFWQNPGNNWGAEEGSFDFTGASRVTFWAKGLTGGEIISKFQIGGISGDFPDSALKAIYHIKLTGDWKQYSIEIAESDLTFISGGFCVILTERDNPEGVTFFLDDICYE